MNGLQIINAFVVRAGLPPGSPFVARAELSPGSPEVVTVIDATFPHIFARIFYIIIGRPIIIFIAKIIDDDRAPSAPRRTAYSPWPHICWVVPVIDVVCISLLPIRYRRTGRSFSISLYGR
jgi:hypothetical protein